MLLACTSTEHSNTTNLVITFVHVAVVLMIAIVGFTKAKPANLVPFVPPEFGTRGIFQGASFVFFRCAARYSAGRGPVCVRARGAA